MGWPAQPMRKSVTLAAAIVTLASCVFAATPDSARAFCRASIDTPPTGPCVELEGSPLLLWNSGCLTLRFHQSMFTELGQLDETDVRFIFEESFLTWEDVDCGFVPFVVQFDETLATSSDVEFLFDQRNESVVVAMSPEQWSAAGQSSAAFAITFLWHDTKTGDLFDVDMGLNLGQGPFGKCGDMPCTDGMVDLQNTITHEAGHVLGLGHTTIADATMVISAEPGDIFMRDLEADDIEGLCALELLSHDCDDGSLECICPEPPIVTRTRGGGGGLCTIGAPSPDDAPWGGLVVLPGLALWLRRRRR